MERRRHALWALRWVTLLLSVAITALNPQTRAEVTSDHRHMRDDTKQSSCPSPKRHLILVSTMDGKVSALNANQEGALEWSVETGDTPLVSSSIGNLEVVQEGSKSRIIPSLGGTLFQFDGETIKPMQIDADMLMSSSFRMTDDTYIVGGKETITYGIDLNSGKLMYVCSMSGCSQLGEDSKAGSRAATDILVVIRQTRTIRAVEMRSGQEKWNFSVGQHEVSLLQDMTSHWQEYQRLAEQYHEDTPEASYADEDATICDSDDEGEEFSWPPRRPTQSNVHLRLMVPQGTVMAVSKTDPDQVIWTHQFESAIATAWSIVDGDLQQISIFDEPAVPALQLANPGAPYEQDQPIQPLLYIGEHGNQFYCQESAPMHQRVSEAFHNVGPEQNALTLMPVIRWRPYLATARSRTPAALGGVNPLQIEYERRQAEAQGLVIWHRQYPYDNGYYLFPDTTPLDAEGKIENESEFAIFYNVAVAMPSLWIWWKEVLAISIGTAVIFNILLFKYCKIFPSASTHRLGSSKVQEGVAIGNEVVETPADIHTVPSLPSTASLNPSDYMSRYCEEFDQRECLGRGGFGVVFEAINKMDDCNYAIKRITLNNSNKARERVMREVKALAKLDHGGIVRYYQAWFESPPPGWQEERDRQLFEDMTAPETNDATSGGDPTTVDPGLISRVPVHAGGDSLNPLNPFWGPLDPLKQLDAEYASTADCDKKRGSSSGFTPHRDLDLSEDSENPHPAFFLDNSISIEFRNSDSENSSSVPSLGVPFGPYRKSHSECLMKESDDSFSVVFEEDSQCTDSAPDSGHEEGDDPSTSHSLSHPAEDVSIPKPGRLRRSSSSPSRSPVRKLRSERSGPSPLKHCHSMPARPGYLELEQSEDRRKDHPVPKLYLYIQMQLCQRETLKDWLYENTLNRDRKLLLNYFDQIVAAVDYIHDCGLMHRDLKPSNIFFSMDGTVKVGDFGLVTAFEEQPKVKDMDLTPMFHTNFTNQVGTKLYMSPEQGEGKPYTHKVDIYSLGLILFELFYPFSTQMERVRTMQDVRKLLFPLRFVRELPDVMALVRQLVAQEPSQRPSTKDVQHNPLLKDFEVARQLINRMRPRTRTHTVSTSESSNSEEHVNTP